MAVNGNGIQEVFIETMNNVGMTDVANVDLQRSIKWVSDSSSFPRKCRQDAMACRLWLCCWCGKVPVRFLGVR